MDGYLNLLDRQIQTHEEIERMEEERTRDQNRTIDTLAIPESVHKTIARWSSRYSGEVYLIEKRMSVMYPGEHCVYACSRKFAIRVFQSAEWSLAIVQGGRIMTIKKRDLIPTETPDTDDIPY